MATDDDNNNNAQSSVNGDEDAKFGFSRPEMYSQDLAYTVGRYDRHVLLCYRSPDSWPTRVEESDNDPLPRLLTAAVKARKNDITIKTKLSTCGGGDGAQFADGDVLIFPDMVKYRGLKESNLEGFVDDVLANAKPWASGVQEVLTGSHVFVCAHGSRDKRCGVCGPALMEKFNEEIALRELKDKVFVIPSAHIGGHKYAGNLIIYGPDPDGKIAGHWYGYVTPQDVPEILDQHIGKGQIIDRLWRGKMGVYEEVKLPNEKKSKEQHQSTQVNPGAGKQTITSCCQGASVVSCCQVGRKLTGTAEQLGKKGLERPTCQIRKWEQGHILMAVGVIGAVAAIAVAYSLYGRSG